MYRPIGTCITGVWIMEVLLHKNQLLTNMKYAPYSALNLPVRIYSMLILTAASYCYIRVGADRQTLVHTS